MTVQHRGFMVWLTSVDDLDTLLLNGDRITQVCLFYLDIQADGSLTPAVPGLDNAFDRARQVAEAWPHIRWLVTIKNDGIEQRIDPLVQDEPGVRDRFFTDLHGHLDGQPWLDGIDGDLERLDNNTRSDIYGLYGRIWDEVHGRAASSWVSFDLPAMTGPYETVGAEKWCNYARFDGIADSVQIMTYGFAYNGSAPGPVSPIWWVRQVADYAARALDPGRVYMGVAAYGIRWQIYDYPTNLGESYRGSSGAFDPFLGWVSGRYSHTDQYRGGSETQQYVPFAPFYEAADFILAPLLHVYDYLDPAHADTLQYPATIGPSDEGERPYLLSYSALQRAEYGGVVAHLAGTDYDSTSGQVAENSAGGYVMPDPAGSATYTFTVPSAGSYVVAVNVLFPWWGRDHMRVTLDGTPHDLAAGTQWYPYRRRTHWLQVAHLTLSAGQHTLVMDGGQSDARVQLHALLVCDWLRTEYDNGRAAYTARPREFSDVDRQAAWPHEDRFKVTVEALRQAPSTAPLWDDRFAGWGQEPPAAYYRQNTGSWSVQQTEAYSYLVGHGHIVLDTDALADIEALALLYVPGAGKAGVTVGDLWLAINTGTGALELWQGGSLVHSEAGAYVPGGEYEVALRVMGDRARALVGGGTAFEATVTPVSGTTGGIRASTKIESRHFRMGDTRVMMPREAVDVVLPDGAVQTVGRVPRAGVTWYDQWGYFGLDTLDEYGTRQDPPSGLNLDISLDWAYLHAGPLTLAGPGDYGLQVLLRDAEVRVSRVHLGDADGFSVSYYPNGRTIAATADIAAYEYRLAGVGMWKLGQEDPAVWGLLTRHV